MKRADYGIALAILLLGAGLRFTGISYGQPNPAYAPQDATHNTTHENIPVHPDEFLFVQRPLRMLLTGQLNPKFFHNPSFLINTHLVVFWLTGERSRLDWEPRADLSARRHTPFRLYLIGRGFSALGGMLAIAGAYGAARLITGRVGAAVAGALVAVSVPMVQHAHYTTTSSLAAGFVMVCIWASWLSLRRFVGWRFALAGICAGLAAGCRYNAAAVSVVVFVVGLVILYQNRLFWVFIWVILGYILFPLTFLFTTPHVILDTAFVWSEFESITNQYIGSEDSPMNVSRWVGLWYELRYLAVFGLGLPAALAAVIGGSVGLQPGRRVAIASMLAFLLPYAYVVLRTIRPLGADQMLVPVIPPLAVLAGVGATWFYGQLRRQTWLTAALLTGVIIAAPLYASLHLLRLFAQPDTRYTAQAWIHTNIPAGAAFHLDGPYNVPLDETIYPWTQTYGGQQAVTVAELQASDANYLIVSDAWYWQHERARFIAPSVLADMQAHLDAVDAVFEPVYTVPRPQVIGTNTPMHSATYWHQPGITIYCIADCYTVAGP